MTKRRCEFCEWFTGPTSRGQCRRRAPIGMIGGPSGRAEFPEVEGRDWCGEWQANVERIQEAARREGRTLQALEQEKERMEAEV